MQFRRVGHEQRLCLLERCLRIEPVLLHHVHAASQASGSSISATSSLGVGGDDHKSFCVFTGRVVDGAPDATKANGSWVLSVMR